MTRAQILDLVSKMDAHFAQQPEDLPPEVKEAWQALRGELRRSRPPSGTMPNVAVQHAAEAGEIAQRALDAMDHFVEKKP